MHVCVCVCVCVYMCMHVHMCVYACVHVHVCVCVHVLGGSAANYIYRRFYRLCVSLLTPLSQFFYSSGPYNSLFYIIIALWHIVVSQTRC